MLPTTAFATDLPEEAILSDIVPSAEGDSGQAVLGLTTESPPVEAPTLDPLPAALEQNPPQAPSNLRGTALDPRRLRLAWQDNSCAEIFQRLQVEIRGDWIDVPFDIGPDVTQLIVSGLDPDTDYHFRVVAVGADGSASRSDAIVVKTFVRGSRCQVDPHQLCLLDGRFRIRVEHVLPNDPQTYRLARAIPDSDRQGAFWFFEPENLEVFVELEEQITDPGNIGLAFGALSDLGYRVTVHDLQTDEIQVYDQPMGNSCGRSIPSAFPIEPSDPTAAPEDDTAGDVAGRTPTVEGRLAEANLPVLEPQELGRLGFDTRPIFTGAPQRAIVTCDRDPAELSLQNDRFRIQVGYIDPDGVEQPALALDATNSAGMFRLGAADRPVWAVKILDGRGFNGYFWLFTSPLQGVEGWIEVRDRLTGDTKVLYNPPGDLCGRTSLLASGGPGIQ